MAVPADVSTGRQRCLSLETPAAGAFEPGLTVHLTPVGPAAAALMAEQFLLEQDVPVARQRIADTWDFIAQPMK